MVNKKKLQGGLILKILKWFKKKKINNEEPLRVENDCCCIDELLNKIGLVILVFECCSLVDVFGRLLIENIGMVGDGILDRTLRLSTI